MEIAAELKLRTDIGDCYVLSTQDPLCVCRSDPLSVFLITTRQTIGSNLCRLFCNFLCQFIGKHQLISSGRQDRLHAGHLIGLLRWLSVAYTDLTLVTDARTQLHQRPSAPSGLPT